MQFDKHHKHTLRIVTGSGHHSDPKKGAVIKPAIIKLCRDEKWNIEAEHHNDGVLIIHHAKHNQNMQ